MKNPMVNYREIIANTASESFNVRDEYKNNTVEQNVEIQRQESRKFSVGVINITGELNIGMMLRSACLMGAENFYIFGRKKFDKRSTVGAENYINIVQYTFNNPLNMDDEVLNQLKVLDHSIVLCEQGGGEIGTYKSPRWHNRVLRNPLFIFGSESHGLPQVVCDYPWFQKVSIPQVGVLRSFNVSAAMNIIVFDYIREMYL